MELACEFSMSERAALAAGDVLAGRGGGIRKSLAFVGPAVVASIPYVDPGNIATNVQAGARYGYDLLWVVLFANGVAMLFQALSAKLGIVTGRNLAELCRAHFPRPVTLAMWIAGEIAAMATDLAEFVGAATGLSLLFSIPLIVGMGLTALIVSGILVLEKKGFRQLELVIGAMVAAIALCYVAEMLLSNVDWASAALHSVTPKLDDQQSVLLAVGIIGATVMPHAVFLHSGLTQSRISPRDDREKRKLLRFSNREVVAALAVAGLVNVAMVLMAAAAFHGGDMDVAEIETAYRALTPALGKAAAALFLVSLLASGVSSSVVGTMAGQMVMQGFVGFRIPIWVRRAVTMLPALAVVEMGVKATDALVLSQVVLSLILPAPMIALLILTKRQEVMGAFVNSRTVQLAATGCAALVIALNGVVVAQSVGLI
jgi:manganese transport protein